MICSNTICDTLFQQIYSTECSRDYCDDYNLMQLMWVRLRLSLLPDTGCFWLIDGISAKRSSSTVQKMNVSIHNIVGANDPSNTYILYIRACQAKYYSDHNLFRTCYVQPATATTRMGVVWQMWTLCYSCLIRRLCTRPCVWVCICDCVCLFSCAYPLQHVCAWTYQNKRRKHAFVRAGVVAHTKNCMRHGRQT